MANNVAPSTNVQLYISGHNLADMDTFSKSDPYAVLSHIPNKRPPNNYNNNSSPAPVMIGRTETIWNDLNPVFQRPIETTFFFEMVQEFTLELFDDDRKGHAGDDKIGRVSFKLSEIMMSNGCKTFNLEDFPSSSHHHHRKTRGQVTIKAVETTGGKVGRDRVANLTFYGTDIKSKGLFGSSSNPFFLLRSRALAAGPHAAPITLYKSEVCRGAKNPRWRPIPQQIPLLQLCGDNGNDEDVPVIVFECYHERSVTDSEVLIGSFSMSLRQLRDQLAQAGNPDPPPQQSFQLKDKSGHSVGTILIDRGSGREGHSQFVRVPSFADYLQCGWEMKLVVSIDFTASNGEPHQMLSLHYMNPRGPNQYLRAIMGVGDVLMHYDKDQKVPVFGFGAKLPGQFKESDFFPLVPGGDSAVDGVQGLINAYGAFLPHVKLWGPTNFAPTIRNITEGARQFEAERTYTVLLIITDGAITDMSNTIDAIVAADDAPLSIVIVGVGSADFSAMEELDGDDVQLKSRTGRVSQRDLVQFVPFASFEREPPEVLAAEVLKEIPRQFEDYAVLAGQNNRLLNSPKSNDNSSMGASNGNYPVPAAAGQGCSAAPLPPSSGSYSASNDNNPTPGCSAAPLPPSSGNYTNNTNYNYTAPSTGPACSAAPLPSSPSEASATDPSSDTGARE